ncbi:MAG: FHA domain-containing protein [Acetobacteraceae bacterium]
MADDALPCGKLRALDPGVLRQRLRVPPEHAAVLDDCDGPSDLLDRLTQRDLLAEAARLFAYGLPERESVWWSCMCVLHTAPADLPDAERRATQAAEAWVRQPDDKTRRDAAWGRRRRRLRSARRVARLGRLIGAAPPGRGDTRGGRGVDTAITPRRPARRRASADRAVAPVHCQRPATLPAAAPGACRQAPDDDGSTEMTLTLSILRCPDGVPPETRRVTGGELSIGRGPQSDWVLPDPDRVLSKRHCVVTFLNNTWQVTDTSANGTFLNHDVDRLTPRGAAAAAQRGTGCSSAPTRSRQPSTRPRLSVPKLPRG